MATSLWIYFTPIYILGGMLLVLGIVAVLGRVRGGKYLRPIMTFLARMPLIGRGIKRMSKAALERANPELASAMRKLERAGAARDPQRAQRALANMTAAERRAYLEAAEQQGAMPAAQNRAMRRQAAKARRR